MYYSGNRYLTMGEMQVNATFIKDYLLTHGWTINAICGVLGNMQTESTINPAIWQGLKANNTAGGYGLVQWTPASKFLNWCTSQNLTPDTMESNLNRIIYEVENGLQWYHPSITFKQFTQSNQPPSDLAMLFLTHYERPANQNQPKRGTQANQWFSYLTETVPPPAQMVFKSKMKPVLLPKKKGLIIHA